MTESRSTPIPVLMKVADKFPSTSSLIWAMFHRRTWKRKRPECADCDIPRPVDLGMGSNKNVPVITQI